MKKNLLLFLFLISYMFSFAQEKIVITGKVHNPTAKTIKFIVNNLFKEDREIYTKRINKNGEFILEYNQFYPHDNYLKYDDELFTYFAAPGDSLHLEITNKSIRFFADHSTLNNEIQLFSIRGRFELFSKVSKAQDNLEPLEYKEEIFRMQAETDSLLEDYFSKQNSSPELIEWTQYKYRYRTIDDLMRYKMFNPNKEIPMEYYDFLFDDHFLAIHTSNNIELNQPVNNNSFDTKMFMSSSANDAVNEVFLFLSKQTVKQNPELTSSKDLKHAYTMFANTIIQSTDGVMREIQMVKLFYQLIEWKQFEVVEANLSTFFKYVKNEKMRSIILDVYSNKHKEILSDHIEQYFSYYTNTEISTLIDSILTKHAGKVIYIDFWATWCGPCLHEMQYSNSLQLDYAGQDINFIYLGVESPEAIWKEKIDELRINGDHYLLTSDQYNVCSDIFQIDGIPHYVLIDKNGKIIERDALSSSEYLIKEQINKLLDQ